MQVKKLSDADRKRAMPYVKAYRGEARDPKNRHVNADLILAHHFIAALDGKPPRGTGPDQKCEHGISLLDNCSHCLFGFK